MILRWVNLYRGQGDFWKERNRDFSIFTAVSEQQWPTKERKEDKLRLLTQVLHEGLVWKGLMEQLLRSQEVPPTSLATTI